MNDLEQQFGKLKDCVANELVCSDGKTVIAYTVTLLAKDEIEKFKQITSEDLYQYLESIGFQSHQVGSC